MLLGRAEPGAAMNPKAKAYVRAVLDRLGVQVRAGAEVVKVLPDAVELAGGDTIAADALLGHRTANRDTDSGHHRGEPRRTAHRRAPGRAEHLRRGQGRRPFCRPCRLLLERREPADGQRHPTRGGPGRHLHGPRPVRPGDQGRVHGHARRAAAATADAQPTGTGPLTPPRQHGAPPAVTGGSQMSVDGQLPSPSLRADRRGGRDHTAPNPLLRRAFHPSHRLRSPPRRRAA